MGLKPKNTPKCSYETDQIVIFPTIHATTGATVSNGRVLLDAVNESCAFYFYIEDKIAPDRPLTITFVYMRADAGADTIDITQYGHRFPCDGTTGVTVIWNYVADTLPASTINRYETKEWTLPTAVADNHYTFAIYMNEAAKQIYVHCVAVRYFKKRTLP